MQKGIGEVSASRRARSYDKGVRVKELLGIVRYEWRVALVAGGVFALLFMIGCDDDDEPTGPRRAEEGQAIFRHDTFGDEQLWTDQLRMHEVIQAAVDPTTALAAGLKVDASRVPAGFLDTADLADPSTTVRLIEFGAVVGLEGDLNDQDSLVSIGVTCALCHSTVDNSVAAGIGQRRDGWQNSDLNPGLILSLSPAMQDPEVQAVLTSWGPGFYDPRWNIDDINHPVVIPPIYGLQGVPLETYTGDGTISYWNAYVGVTQMGAKGSFSDPRIGVNIQQTPDLLTPKLPALLAYQLSLPTPSIPADSFDAAAAGRGEALFNGAAACATCHVPPTYTNAGDTLYLPAEVGQEPLTAQRSATGRYRTTPLRGLVFHPPYFHDGSAPTLEAVVDHYESFLDLTLTDAERADLVEFLRSL